MTGVAMGGMGLEHFERPGDISGLECVFFTPGRLAMKGKLFSRWLESFVLGYWGALGIVVLMALESTPVIGLFLPGVFIMVGLGSLSGTSYLTFGECVLYASTGALIGDSIGYWLGHFGVEHRLLHPDTRKTRRSRAQARHLVEKYGRLAVFLGRFVWFFHPAVPLMAGMSGIRPGWFYLADLPAVVLWVLIYGGIGHWATGMAREKTLEFFIGLGILIAIVLAALAVRYLLKRRQGIPQQHSPGGKRNE